MKILNTEASQKRFYLPAKVVDNPDILKDRYKKRSKLAYILHVIVFLSNYAVGYKDQTSVPVYSQHLRAVVGNSYKKYIDWLKQNDIILQTANYSKEYGTSNKYALTEEYKGDIRTWTCTDKKLIKRMVKYYMNEKRGRLFYQTQPYIYVRKCIEKTEIDTLNAKWAISDMDLTEGQRRSYTSFVNSVDSGYANLTVNPTNERIQTPITTSPASLRKYLSLDGCSDLVEMDISNSQMFFLARLILQHLSSRVNTDKLIRDITEQVMGRDTQTPYVSYPQTIPQHTIKFITDALTGNVYERVANEQDLTREQAKEISFQVLFSNQYSFQDKKREWANVYPDVFDFCYEYKIEHGYNQLAITLQKAESAKMLNLLQDLRGENIPCLSIFDSIITKREDAKRALNLFRKQFSPVPHIHTNELQ